MNKPFDPYHVWLGIPPKDQPPNHYRLLGIELLEENADVIDAASMRQTSYLRGMSSGEHRRESQQILNEISAARRCLLDADKKAAYDADLGTNQNVTSLPADEAVIVEAEPVPSEESSDSPFPQFGQIEEAEAPAFPTFNTDTPTAPTQGASVPPFKPATKSTPSATAVRPSMSGRAKKSQKEVSFWMQPTTHAMIGVVVFILAGLVYWIQTRDNDIPTESAEEHLNEHGEMFSKPPEYSEEPATK